MIIFSCKTNKNVRFYRDLSAVIISKTDNNRKVLQKNDFSKVRFKGDEQRAATVYAGYEALKAEDIADAISYCVNAPERVSIAELCIYPKAQAEPRTIYKK